MITNKKKTVRLYTFILLTVVICFQPLSASADEVDTIVSQHKACVDQNSTNMAWGDCGATALAALDKLLNQVWPKATDDMGKISRQSLDNLFGEERAWIKWKDQACQYYASGDFGREGQVLDYPFCKEEILVNRIHYLQNLSKELESH